MTPVTKSPVIATSSLWKNISILRGIAMCLVVVNHAIQSTAGILFGARTVFTPYSDLYAFITVFLIRGVTPVCIIAFIFASGFTVYRFLDTRKKAFIAAGQLLRKYLIWSLGLYGLMAIFQRRIDWEPTIRGIVCGGPMPAYWFLVVLIVLYATARVWVRLVKERPKAAMWLAAGIQIASCAYLYLLPDAITFRFSAWLSFFTRPLAFLPVFIAGMFVSREAARISFWLTKYRKPLIFATVCSAIINYAEAFILGARSEFRTDRVQNMYATERAGLVLLALLLICLVITAEFKNPRVASWLTHIGNSSLGIMLLMDLCMKPLTVLIWHLPGSPFAWQIITYQGNIYQRFVDMVLWFTPIFFAAGLWGPLVTMALIRKVIGNRSRYLW